MSPASVTELTPNTDPAESTKPLATGSEAKANEENLRLADRMTKAAIEGLNRLAREQAPNKPRHAA